MNGDPRLWLTGQLDRAEQVARRACGAWTGRADGWRISIIDEQGRTVAHLPNRLTAGDPEGDYATATLIESNDPLAVLRRVAADRRILAVHAPTRTVRVAIHADGAVCAAEGCECEVEVPACGVCASGHAYDAEVVPAPCGTVVALAEGWGWPGVG